MRMTTAEIKLITFVMLALLIGASAKSYRTKHPRSQMSTPPPKEAVGNRYSPAWKRP